MQFKFFVIPLKSHDDAEEEMNRFLRSYRFLAVEKCFTEGLGNSCWAFCVEYIEGAKEKSPKEKPSPKLEDRFMDFAVAVIQLTESLPKTKEGNHIAGQLIRSGTSAAPNYGEAQDAESRADFIHKMKISLGGYGHA